MKELENLATAFIAEMGQEMFKAALPTASPISVSLIGSMVSLLTNEEFINQISFHSSHSALDVAQDALDSCDHGRLSHEAALKICAIALADDQARKIKRTTGSITH